MAFQARQLLDIHQCPACQGKGCQSCGQFGLYAEIDNQRILFPLPDSFELGIRKEQKKSLFIKRVLIILIAAFLSLTTWIIIL